MGFSPRKPPFCVTAKDETNQPEPEKWQQDTKRAFYRSPHFARSASSLDDAKMVSVEHILAVIAVGRSPEHGEGEQKQSGGYSFDCGAYS